MSTPVPPCVGLCIALLLAGAGQVSVADPAGAPVVVAPVEQVELAAAQSFVGTVYPARVSDVGSAVDGRVVRMPVDNGQRVSAGETIAELLRGLLEIERSGAAAELERRAHVLAELRAGSRPEELDQARAIVAGATARVDYARNRLARLARLAANPAITLTGRVPDTRPYIAAAGVYVVPLRIGGGTRLKVLEAMAMSQAIVSTRLGCDGFDFRDGQEVSFADEPAAFAAAVIGLLRDRAQAAALGQAARAYVEAHYGWRVIVPQLEALYT